MSWFGLRELFDVQGLDPVRLINAQGNGQQVIELAHGHGTCLEEVAPLKQRQWRKNQAVMDMCIVLT